LIVEIPLKIREARRRLGDALTAAEQSGAPCGKFYPDTLRLVLDGFDAMTEPAAVEARARAAYALGDHLHPWELASESLREAYCSAVR
jgi:hypothetical protein